jgi:small subunit ribosomal protein S20
VRPGSYDIGLPSFHGAEGFPKVASVCSGTGQAAVGAKLSGLRGSWYRGPLCPRAGVVHLSIRRKLPVANIKSQLKRIKTNEKARQRNKATKSELKTYIRRFREAANAGNATEATELARVANRALDRAASKGVIHRNQAANRKSAIAAKAASLG